MLEAIAELPVDSAPVVALVPRLAERSRTALEAGKVAGRAFAQGKRLALGMARAATTSDAFTRSPSHSARPILTLIVELELIAGSRRRAGLSLIARRTGNHLAASLAVSAYATDEHRRKVMKTGFQKHLEKPVAPAELVMEVARLAGRLDGVASH